MGKRIFLQRLLGEFQLNTEYGILEASATWNDPQHGAFTNLTTGIRFMD